MDIVKFVFDFVFHLDKHLAVVIQNTGMWSYILFFVIIFCETGLVVTPFLPGDSLLFALGAFVAIDSLNVFWLFISLSVAAISGDSLNYAIGKFFGKKIIERGKFWMIKKEHIDRTHKFYEKYGAKTIVLARFVPIVRTFAPFVAGIGNMSYLRFFTYNVAGGVLWIAVFIFGGFFFGNIRIIKENFSVTIFVIIFISMLPGIIEVWRHKRQHKRAGGAG